MLSDLLAGFYGDFEQRGFTVRVELDGDLPPVRADRNGAVRVLSNLLNNALKHGGQELTVRLYREGDALITSFSNLAPTLTQEDLPHIFDRFYTADQMRTGQNTGLGLAIVKALAQRMGHTVWARLDGQEFTVAVRWKLER